MEVSSHTGERWGAQPSLHYPFREDGTGLSCLKPALVSHTSSIKSDNVDIITAFNFKLGVGGLAV